MTDRFEPDWISLPGDTILDLLGEKHWSQAELATRTGFTRKHINELVSGKATLTPETALKLEATLGGPARFWLAREAQYREALARSDARTALGRESKWLSELPVADMIRFRWIKSVRGTAARVSECLAFFGVASVDAWREQYAQPLAAFRKSSKVASSTAAISVWLRQGEREAQAVECRPFNDAGFRTALRALRELTRQSEPSQFLPRLIVTCAAEGVAVVFVPTPRGCPVSGATRWLAPTKAVLQLSLRYKTNDHLWFTLFHEAGHLLLHGKRLLFLEGADAISREQEDEANRFARDVLIPPSEAARLRTIAKSHEAVSAFAQRVGVAPGIVVGRMQNEKLIDWSHLNDLKVRYEWDHSERTA